MDFPQSPAYAYILMLASGAVLVMLYGFAFWVCVYCYRQAKAGKAPPFTLRDGTLRVGLASVTFTGDPKDVDGAQDAQMAVLEKRVTVLEDGQRALYAAAQEVFDARTAKLLLTEESHRENRHENGAGASPDPVAGGAAQPRGD